MAASPPYFLSRLTYLHVLNTMFAKNTITKKYCVQRQLQSNYKDTNCCKKTIVFCIKKLILYKKRNCVYCVFDLRTELFFTCFQVVMSLAEISKKNICVKKSAQLFLAFISFIRVFSGNHSCKQ